MRSGVEEISDFLRKGPIASMVVDSLKALSFSEVHFMEFGAHIC